MVFVSDLLCVKQGTVPETQPAFYHRVSAGMKEGEVSGPLLAQIGRAICDGEAMPKTVNSLAAEG